MPRMRKSWQKENVMPKRNGLGGLALAASAVLVIGCGASAPVPSSSSTSQTSSPTLYRYGATCQPSQLQLEVGRRISEATEQDTLLLVFRNISATECDLRGYPGVALADSTGAQLAFKYGRHGDQMLTSRRPSLVALPPGGVAYSAINKNSCVTFASRTAVRAEVIPPGDHDPLVLRLPRYPMLGYCGTGDPGHVVDIAPVEPASADVLAQ
jgi:hypothetical protein